MITIEQIRSILGQQKYLNNTEDMKAWLNQLKDQRHPFYLGLEEFNQVLEWKLGQQFGRQRTRRCKNTDTIVRNITKLAFEIHHEDEDYEIELRFGILCSLRGVAVPVASALLALALPEKYTVVDFRVWRQIFDENKTTFTVGDYKKYYRRLQPIAAELGCSVQEADHAIWEYDMQFPYTLTTASA